MTISIIAALSRNGVIGADNRLPWRLPEDLARFKRLTLEHSVIMGRKTFESIGKPLPKRRNIVLTRNATNLPAGVTVARSLDEAFELTSGEEEVFVAGGAEIYRQTLERANRMYLTRIHADIEGDAYFPAFDESAWRISEKIDHADAVPHGYSFVTFERAESLSHHPA
jgi:dihydrofolate reductase